MLIGLLKAVPQLAQTDRQLYVGRPIKADKAFSLRIPRAVG